MPYIKNGLPGKYREPVKINEITLRDFLLVFSFFDCYRPPGLAQAAVQMQDDFLLFISIDDSVHML